MNVSGVANCSIRGWRKKSEFSLMISTADLLGPFGGSEAFFDGVATLTMVNDLCFLPVLLFLLLLRTIAALVLLVAVSTECVVAWLLKDKCALVVAVARAREKRRSRTVSVAFLPRVYHRLDARAFDRERTESWIIQSLCPKCWAVISAWGIGEKLRSGVGHGWRAKKKRDDGRTDPSTTRSKKETNEEKVHQTHHWLRLTWWSNLWF